MSDPAGTSQVRSVTGTLRFHETEGGFWSLELDPADPQLGGGVVLDAADVAPGMTDGARVRARVRAREEQFGFQMAGTRVEVLGELTLAG